MSTEYYLGFEIYPVCDPQYREITIMVQYKDKKVAQFNKDRGENLIEIEFISDIDPERYLEKFPLEDFLLVVEKAKQILINEA